MGQLFWNLPTKWQKHYQYGVKHHFGVIIEESKHREVIHYAVLHSSAVIVSLVKDFQRGWGRFNEIFAVKQLKHYQYKIEYQIENQTLN